jgi:transposase
METQQRKPYPTDLTDAEWAKIAHLVPKHTNGSPLGGRRPKYSQREILNALFYITKAGCTWRMLPHDLPPWQAVYGYFAEWRDAGVFMSINKALRRQIRIEVGKNPEPSATIMDSQSVKTAEKGGPTR